MATANQLIEYQRRCYEADNRETGISSLVHPKIRHLKFLDGSEVIVSGTLPRVALPKKYGATLQKEAFKYRRDKSLIYAAFPIVGDGNFDGRLPAKVCAPLVFLQAGFEESKGSLFLQPSLEEPRVNFPALASIAEATGADAKRLEQFLVDLPPLPWTREQLHSLAAALAEVLPTIDFTPLAAFPELVDSREIMRHIAQEDESADAPQEPESTSLVCLPAAAVALIPNSPETRGVLYELAQVSSVQHHSKPLRVALRLDGQTQASTSVVRWPVVPSVLSDAQRRGLSAGSRFPLTLISGPPGTGKSHTIASIALDHLARRQTVLIASRMDQAVDVVAGKIESLIGPTDAVVRAGRKEHRRELKRKLQDLLQGIAPSKKAAHDEESGRSIRRRLKKLDKSIASIESSILRQLEHELAWGALDVAPALGAIRRFANSFAKGYREWCLKETDVWQASEVYEQQLEHRCQLARTYLTRTLSERVERLLRRRREDLTKFLQAIRARSDSKQQTLFEEIAFSVLLHAFPVWLCKLTDLSNVLPLKRELFDVAILDEATQCDIASCLPLFHRAKRVVVVGDAKQLRHISFLPESRQQALAEECELEEGQQEQFHYRNRSILDAVSDSIQQQQQVVFLNEHFRSLPAIIRFSNQNFYANSLALMRERPDTVSRHCVEVRKSPGRRTSNGKNIIEAEQLIDELFEHVELQQDWNANNVDSIGVLSPFRDQVDLLASVLDRRLSYDQMTRHDLLVGTAHTFQGEQRDAMYLSLAIDDDAHAATVRFLNTPNLLNVAVTRARHLQILYTSFDVDGIDKQSLLHRLIQDALSPQSQAVAGPRRAIDSFRVEVVEQLNSLGFKTWRDYRVAGEAMDLIVESKQQSIALDLIGYPGQLARAYTLERYRMLRRAGLRVLPLCYRDWKQRQEEMLARIKRQLSEG